MGNVKKLEFRLGEGRTEWYKANTSFGVSYIVLKSKDGMWEYIRPNCNSSPSNRPKEVNLGLAFDKCQTHFDKIVRECLL